MVDGSTVTGIEIPPASLITPSAIQQCLSHVTKLLKVPAFILMFHIADGGQSRLKLIEGD
jgi:hypothetical protein